MIYKSTQSCRDWWGKFTVALQAYTLINQFGSPISKREVFETLFDPDTSSQVQLELVMSGFHQQFGRVQRYAFDEAANESDLIHELTQEVAHEAAVSILRGNEQYQDDPVGCVMAGIVYAVENYRCLQKEVGRKLDEKRKAEFPRP